MFNFVLFLQVTDEPASKEQLRLLHATIKKVSTETEEMRFNTGIAAMMEFINGVYKWDNRCVTLSWYSCFCLVLRFTHAGW
jgi:leucyl-tRNA synthetase